MIVHGKAQYIVRITDGEHVWYWVESGDSRTGKAHGCLTRAEASRVDHARAQGLIAILSAPGGFDRTEATQVTMVRAGSRDPYYWEK